MESFSKKLQYGLDGAFTLAYKITDETAEMWSHRFTRFKGKNLEAFYGGAKMMKAGAAPEGTFHVGDQPEDTEASRAAKVFAIGSAWGIEDPSALKASKPDKIFATVAELEKFLLKQT